MKIKLFTTFLAVLLIAFPATAQKATVKSFVPTTDHIPSGDRRNDLNGNPCALVKVQVVDNIERIEGNTIGDVINRGVEKWVYMCKGSRNMRIHLKNFLPVMVKFLDYNVNGLESNRVYELVIEVPKTAAANNQITEVKGNNFQMRVSPNYATLTIWSDDMPRQVYRPQDDGMLNVFLPYGRYHYQASANGYETMEGTVFVNDEASIHNVNLSAVKGTLTISCPTEKVDFYLNNEILIKNEKALDWIGQVVPGSYEVRISRKGYVPQTKTVRVVARENTVVQFDRLMTEAEQKKLAREKEKAEEEAIAKEKADSLAKVKAQQKEEEEAIAKEKADSLAKVKAQQKEEEERVKAEEAKERAEQKKQKREATAKKMEELGNKPIVFGVTAGYNMATAQFAGNGSIGSQAGFHIGVTAEFRLSSNFYFNTGLLYSGKGYTYEDKSKQIDETGKGSFVDIPIQASYRLPLGPTVKLQINAGPYAALCVGGNVKDNLENLYDESFSSAYGGFDYGAQAGLGIDIYHYFHVGVAYQLGLGSKYQNRNLMIGVGVRF